MEVEDCHFQDLSDLSDQEDAEQLDLSPFLINWLDLTPVCENKLGISSLPGCKYKDKWRSLSYDIKCLKENGVEDVFCLCTKGEFHLYRVHNLLEKYTDAGLTVHHFPIEDSLTPTIKELVKILEDLRQSVTSGRKSLIHCFGGLGRSCLVSMCFLMFLDGNISITEVRERIQELRGGKAQGSVKQYNYISDFREILANFMATRGSRGTEEDRCASR